MSPFQVGGQNGCEDRKQIIWFKETLLHFVLVFFRITTLDSFLALFKQQLKNIPGFLHVTTDKKYNIWQTHGLDTMKENIFYVIKAVLAFQFDEYGHTTWNRHLQFLNTTVE